MSTYGFDGWTSIGRCNIHTVHNRERVLADHGPLLPAREYPVAPERGGRRDDFANYLTWLSNLRAAFTAAGHSWGITITLPSSFWYLQNFDVVKLEPVVDWFNMLGSWSLIHPGPSSGWQTHDC
jgi:hypothetical protein